MTYHLEFNSSEFADILDREFDRIKQPCQQAMANEVLGMTKETFGVDGSSRIQRWKNLSKRYAQRIGRKEPTLQLTGDEAYKVGGEAGKLMASVQITEDNQDHCTVASVGCEYAEAHQYGNEAKNIPRRPFLPLNVDGEVTPKAVKRVTDALLVELNAQLNLKP